MAEETEQKPQEKQEEVAMAVPETREADVTTNERRDPDVDLAMATIDASHDLAMYFDDTFFNRAYRASRLLASSTLVPTHFQRMPQNVFIALQIAYRLKLDPFMVMQKMYVVHGRPSFEAQFVIALVNRSGRFRGPINWEEGGEGDQMYATAFLVRLDGTRVSETVTIAMAKAEGWFSKEGSKWRTIPKLMLKYRSAAFLARLHCPEVTMGMHTQDELEDTPVLEMKAEAKVPPPPELEPPAPSRTDEILGMLTAAEKRVEVQDNTKSARRR